MAQIEERHRRMCETLAGLWEARMKPHYFAPAAKLKELRRTAIELGRKRSPGLRAAATAAHDEEMREAVAAQERFQGDFDAACGRLIRKRDIELGVLKSEARRRSAIRCRSQAVSPRTAALKRRVFG
jgi:hypothetical protein